MHADTLYHRMLDQEMAIEKAKAEGQPVPTFAPLIDSSKRTATADDEAEAPALSPERQKSLAERLEKLPADERLAEEEARKAEMRAKAEIASKVTSLWEERKNRKENGTPTMADRFAALFSSEQSSGKS